MAAELRVYRRLVGARIRSDWQYRTSFLMFLLSQSVVAGLDLAVVLVLFTQVDALAGWSAFDVSLLFGIAGVSFGIGDLLVSPVELASRHIKAGTFDLFLLRPAGSLSQLCASEFALRRLGRTVQPLVVLVFALTHADIDWSVDKGLMLLLALVSGTVIWGSIWVLTSSIAFWTVETQEMANSFTYGGLTLSHYPVDVLSSWLRRIVVFVIPIAFTAYLPAAYVLDKPRTFGLSRDLAWASPLVALLLAVLARTVWQHAVRHYRSTGS